MKKISQLILIVTIICFSWIFLFSFKYDSSVYMHYNQFISLVVAIIILVIWYLIYHFLIVKMINISRKKETIFLIIYFLIVFFAQFIVLNQLDVLPAWDYGVIYDNALKYALNSSRNNAVYIEYFQYFPNNILLFVMMVIAIRCGRIFGLKALFSIELMNIIFIDLSLMLLYITVRKVFGKKEAIMSSIISLFFISLFLYSPIVYSDTLSLFIGILLIYLFTLLDEKKSEMKNIILLIAIGFVAFMGKNIKVTSLIVLIALLFNYFFKNKFKENIISILIIMITFLTLSVGFNVVIVNKSSFNFKINEYGSIPYTHWIMMGVEDKDVDNSDRNTYGGYNLDDYKFTQNFKNGKSAQPYNIKEYKKRVSKLGIIGYADFLTKKSVNIWTDGYYFANVKLLRQPVQSDSLMRNFLFNDEHTKLIGIYFTQGVTLAFLISLIAGSIIKLKENEKGIDVVRLALIGIMIFLMFWEGRSRYLVNFIPLFIYIIVEFYYLLNKYAICQNKK